MSASHTYVLGTTGLRRSAGSSRATNETTEPSACSASRQIVSFVAPGALSRVTRTDPGALPTTACQTDVWAPGAQVASCGATEAASTTASLSLSSRSLLDEVVPATKRRPGVSVADGTVALYAGGRVTAMLSGVARVSRRSNTRLTGVSTPVDCSKVSTNMTGAFGSPAAGAAASTATTAAAASAERSVRRGNFKGGRVILVRRGACANRQDWSSAAAIPALTAGSVGEMPTPRSGVISSGGTGRAK